MEDLTLEEQEKLDMVYETSLELKQAHVLKEEFLRIFEEEDNKENATNDYSKVFHYVIWKTLP